MDSETPAPIDQPDRPDWQCYVEQIVCGTIFVACCAALVVWAIVH